MDPMLRAGRRAVLLAIDPAFADVIVRRWQEATGEAAVLEGQGRTFVDVAGTRLMIENAQS